MYINLMFNTCLSVINIHVHFMSAYTHYCPPAIFYRKFRGVIRFPSSVRPSVPASVRPCVTSCAARNLLGGSLWFFAWNLPIMVQQKPIFKIFKKSNMAAATAIIIDNFQLKYRKVCAGRNLWGRSFLFSTWSLPIILQQKPIFKIFKKSNMAAATAIIIDNFQLKYRKVCAGRNLWGRYF